MIHLFDQVYFSQDIFGLYNNKSRKRLYITDHEFDIPLTVDQHMQRVVGIVGVFTSLSDADEQLGGRENLWKNIIGEKKDLNIVASNEVTVELLVQYWKSTLVSPTLNTLYTLYCLVMENENHIANSNKMNNILPKYVSVLDKYRVIPVMSKEDFVKLYESTEPVEALSVLEISDRSIEMLVAGYLTHPENEEVRKTLFSKMDRIITKSFTETFVDLALTLHRRFTSLNRSHYDDMEVSFSPYENIEKIPELAWTLKESILNRDMAAVIKEFPMHRMIEIFKVVDTLDVFVSSEKNKDLVNIATLLMNKDFDVIIHNDMREQRRNSLFSDNRFNEKVNALMISYFYRLTRLKKFDELETFLMR